MVFRLYGCSFFGLRTHELLNEEIEYIFARILSAWDKAECYDEVANHSQRIFILIQNNNDVNVKKLKNITLRKE